MCCSRAVQHGVSSCDVQVLCSGQQSGGSVQWAVQVSGGAVWGEQVRGGGVLCGQLLVLCSECSYVPVLRRGDSQPWCCAG